ncbi:hypothetical protein TrVFT333_007694 [Trichoderma virens FT-333]|nr:hypothetical protein TrVFT333_007694 [Trichoderma virens FT-333]
MAAPRQRRSIQRIEQDYLEGTDKVTLQNLVKAWQWIKDLPSHDPNSFFASPAFTASPFAVQESAPGCEDLTMPYWDETLVSGEKPIPSIFTDPEFEGKPNPLCSYTLQETLVHNVKGANGRYTKKKGYATVRYPLSGLVGNPEDEGQTVIHNTKYPNPGDNTKILNKNVAAWLNGTVRIPDDGSRASIPDTYSIHRRFQISLGAPNYTVFSNTTSQNQWIKDFKPKDKHYVVSLESPHNAMHLALGGFYQKDKYNADPIIGANGDMGDNETASFDPIFYFHHCFIDYAFWVWQKFHEKTERGSLEVIPYYPGTIVPDNEASPFLPPGTKLSMDTSLYPFRKPDETYYSSHDVTNIAELGYDYEPGSLEYVSRAPLGELPEISSRIVKMKRVHNISRAEYLGSFVIRTFVGTSEEDKVEIGHEPVLSRRNIAGCANCQNKLEVESLIPIYDGMLEAAFDGKNLGELQYWTEIHTHDDFNKTHRGGGFIGWKPPVIDDLY